MTSSRLSQRGQGAVTPMSIAVFFLLYFTFVMTLIWLVEGIVPMYLTTDVSLLAIGSALVVVGAMITAQFLEREITIFGTTMGSAPITAWHLIHFAFLGVIALNVGAPLLIAVTKSAMFTTWLIAIFIVIPFIAFTIAMYQIIMGSGGA